MILRGVKVDPILACEVIDYEASGFEFRPGRDKCMGRNTEPTLITVHDTAGEGTGKAIYQNLLRRKVSVHFAIDRQGIVWQYCDPTVVTAYHMGHGNSRSIGIEMANAVFPGGAPPWRFAFYKKFVLTGRERLYGRSIVEDDYRGKVRRVLGHFDVQKKSLAILVRTLLFQFPTIPRRLPMLSPLMGPAVTLPPFRVTGQRLDPAFQGIASHLHFTDGHVDAAGDWCEGLSDLAA